MKTICLTGGLASGKSTVSMFLEALGANVIDADKLGHRVYEPGSQGFIRVVEAFGEDIVGDDNHINRRILGSKVFGNPDELKKLTDIVWPEIRRLAEMEISGFEAAYPDGVVVLEAAVLFEAGWQNVGDEVWVIVVDRELAIERAMARDMMDRAQVESRLDAQLSNEERVSLADVVIENDSTEEAIKARINAEWQRLQAKG